ncbi:MAG: hypothetical protein PVF34_07335, partial [Gammaproteobacteria bacterium]
SMTISRWISQRQNVLAPGWCNCIIPPAHNSQRLKNQYFGLQSTFIRCNNSKIRCDNGKRFDSIITRGILTNVVKSE